MKRLIILALFLLCPAAFANSDGMRCGNALITRGDSVLRVQHECGDPAYASQYVVYGLHPVYNGLLHVYADETVPITVEEWTYNFGPTRFMRKLRFENGELVTIESLEYGF
jgi:hypothetical protein